MERGTYQIFSFIPIFHPVSPLDLLPFVATLLVQRYFALDWERPKKHGNGISLFWNEIFQGKANIYRIFSYQNTNVVGTKYLRLIL